ncbi:hypothetical protein FQA39_LY07481 [Lamprigera yunnana]|nr:hypothetical protein FQA39_LY07481 [Lamprigera yunnana]
MKVYSPKFLGNIRLNHRWIKPAGYDTGIKIFNCIAKDKVPLVLRNKEYVSWYTCGPTVYDSAHIGHASCYIKLDIIQRILRKHFAIKLVTVMNVTDIDDKIINKSIETKTPINEIAKYYEKEFWEDMKSLDVMQPNIIVRVTENLPLIERFVTKLLDKGVAYHNNEGSVVFNIGDYGKLQHVPRAAEGPPYANFTIWKASKEHEGNWNMKYTSGRPGWHTECAALASSFFGSTLDFHTGGDDLRFPHHENEEAQCCSYFSKPQWVNYWIHTGHLMTRSTKMSKSLKNTTSIRSLLQLCSANTFRMMCIMSHYRNSMEFTPDYVHSAEKRLDMFKNFLVSCNLIINGNLKACIDVKTLKKVLKDSEEEVHHSLCNDFDTAQCIKILENLMHVVNKSIYTQNESLDEDNQAVLTIHFVKNFVLGTLSLFGLNLEAVSSSKEISDFNEILNILIEFRHNIRLLAIESKNKVILELCDEVRKNLIRNGINVQDRKSHSTWSK